MKRALIIGGGFAGCAMAHQLALAGGWQTVVIEALPYLGAGVRTRYCGGHPYTFGPRHFLTTMEHVFQYLNGLVPLRRCADHQFLTYVERDSQFYGYPIHRDDIPRMPEAARIDDELGQINVAALAGLSQTEIAGMKPADLRKLNIASQAKNFEEFWVYSIGDTLYRKFVDAYSRKMWMIDDNKLIDDFTWSPKGVTIKEGPRAAWDTAISAYPIAFNGYDDYFRLATAEAEVKLGTTISSFDIPNKTVVFGGTSHRFDVIVNTISPDILFDRCHGELPYIGRELHAIVLPVEFALPENVYFCYYAGNEAFTRIVEYKKFTLHKAPTTLITLEIPSQKNKHYPLPFESEKAKAKKYFAEMPDGVFSIGRAGSYLYNVDIDDTIDQAMRVMAQLKS
ncbi:MAG TPA: UDP-galactopyranose mutase [Candidatus Sulfotelmatobacter sp.]|nr:UDP-galactopyranose mutase [Candidatus Sulfotelmatobacter sp.]